MAGLIRRGEVDAVVVGCDRVAANGDTANKVGTYPLALAARAAGIPFVVAGPTSTIDPALPDGDGIEIEERDGDEVRAFGAAQTTVAGTAVRNPAFDVTPGRARQRPGHRARSGAAARRPRSPRSWPGDRKRDPPPAGTCPPPAPAHEGRALGLHARGPHRGGARSRARAEATSSAACWPAGCAAPTCSTRGSRARCRPCSATSWPARSPPSATRSRASRSATASSSTTTPHAASAGAAVAATRRCASASAPRRSTRAASPSACACPPTSSTSCIVLDGLDAERATFVEPLACVLRAFDRCGLQAGDSLLVVGCGTQRAAGDRRRARARGRCRLGARAAARAAGARAGARAPSATATSSSTWSSSARRSPPRSPRASRPSPPAARCASTRRRIPARRSASTAMRCTSGEVDVCALVLGRPGRHARRRSRWWPMAASIRCRSSRTGSASTRPGARSSSQRSGEAIKALVLP